MKSRRKALTILASSFAAVSLASPLEGGKEGATQNVDFKVKTAKQTIPRSWGRLVTALQGGLIFESDDGTIRVLEFGRSIHIKEATIISRS
jgi:hypothetical protein